MKHLKKLASIVLALVMVLAMAIPVMAADPTTGTITISNATDGAEYKAYKIFDLKSYSDTTPSTPETGKYSYKVADGWEDFINNNADAKAFVEVNKDGYVDVKDNSESTVKAFANAAIEYAKVNPNTISVAGTARAIVPEGDTTTTVTIKDLTLGYYLVDSTVGTLCSLDTTNPTVTIEDKNEEPTLDKEVEENSTKEYGEKNDASIGDKVNFQATITAQAGAENYVMHDTMSQGLSFDGKDSISAVIRKKGETTGTSLVEGRDYEVTIPKAAPDGDGCTFEIKFSAALEEGDVIVVSYSATVNADAVIRGEGNPNNAHLSYGENHSTTPSTTKTYVWDFDILKKGGDTKKALAGAEFTLGKLSETNTTKPGDPIKFVKESDPASNAAPIVYRVATATEINNTAVKKETTIVTPESGKIKFEGLDSGTYYLTETKAPDGYNTPKDPFEVVIKTEESNSVTITLDGKDTNEIENNTGVELPGTGGIGTTIFYIVGGILVVGAAVILVSKKRTKDE